MENTDEIIVRVSAGLVQDYLFAHENDDAKKIALSNRKLNDISPAVLANQIKCRQKARHKLPTWYGTRGIVYPPSLNLEQSSSEVTARFKSQLAKEWNVHRIADLTAGFGVDSYFFSHVAHVDAVEPNAELVALAKHNHRVLGATIQYHHTYAEAFLERSQPLFDLAFIDPSRRGSHQQRLVRLADCEPDVTKLQTPIFTKAKYLLIKAAPLLDIQQAIRELQNTKAVYVVAVDNEVKELLFLCEKDFTQEPAIHAVNLKGEEISYFSFSFSEEKNTSAASSPPLAFVCEPNAALLKSGAFKTVANRYQLLKLAPHTHLYSSAQPVENFPGRVFQVIEAVKLDKKLVSKFPDGRANILVRNYPLSVEELKKKTGLKEGGELYLIGCSGVKEKYLMIAQRVK